MNKFDGLVHAGDKLFDPTTGKQVQEPLSTAQLTTTYTDEDGLVLYPNGLIMDRRANKPVIYDDYNGMGSAFAELVGHNPDP